MQIDRQIGKQIGCSLQRKDSALVFKENCIESVCDKRAWSLVWVFSFAIRSFLVLTYTQSGEVGLCHCLCKENLKLKVIVLKASPR